MAAYRRPNTRSKIVMAMTVEEASYKNPGVESI
jgi:hypothetical protein